jgi:hypothetical protein
VLGETWNVTLPHNFEGGGFRHLTLPLRLPIILTPMRSR